MRVFLVAVQDARGDPTAFPRLLEEDDRFQETYPYIDGKVWLVAAKSRTVTTGDIVDVLTRDDEKERPSPLVLVIEVDEYNGVAEPALWQKLRAWERISDG